MKSIILNLFIAVGLFFAGCSDQSSINSPQQDPQKPSTLVKLSDNSLHKPISISKTINGNIGGQIDIVGSFDNGLIQIKGTLSVPPGAYFGNQTITVFMEGTYAVIDLGPSPFTFNIPLNFTMEITGLQLTGDPKAYQFVYINPNGNLLPVELVGNTVVDHSSKTLSVYNAQLPHFSRYGWAK